MGIDEDFMVNEIKNWLKWGFRFTVFGSGEQVLSYWK